MAERLKRLTYDDKRLLEIGVILPETARIMALRYLDHMPTISEEDFLPETTDPEYLTQEGAMQASRYFRRTVSLIEQDLPDNA